MSDEVLRIEEKQRKSANLAEALRKSLRLRQHFRLPQYGIVSLRVTTSNGYGEDNLVKCHVVHSGAVVQSLDARQIAQLPKDVAAIVRSCTNSKKIKK